MVFSFGFAPDGPSRSREGQWVQPPKAPPPDYGSERLGRLQCFRVAALAVVALLLVRAGRLTLVGGSLVADAASAVSVVQVIAPVAVHLRGARALVDLVRPHRRGDRGSRRKEER